MNLDTEITLLLYRMNPASLRRLMTEIARYVRDRNISRINTQTNADGSHFAPRKKGGRNPMLTGYARRIRTRVELDQAVIGVFGRMGKFGAVHDQGKIERRVRYPSRNILSLPTPDKLVILDKIRRHIGGAA